MDAELQLVIRAKTDPQQFQLLYQKYLPEIFNYCRNRLGNQQQAEDLTSSVFLKAVDKIELFNPKKGVSFRAWLFRITQNSLIDFYRKHKEVTLVEVKETSLNLEAEMEQHFVQQEQRKQVLATLLCLKQKYQQVLTLKFFTEMQPAEIAEVMDLKTKQVAVLLHRALKSFAKKYRQKYPQSEIFTLVNRNQ